MKFSCDAKLSSGALVIEDNQTARLKKWAATQDDAKVVLAIKRHREKRTIPQNSYYWAAVVSPLALHLGEDIDTMHNNLKQNFLPAVMRDGLEIALSTTDLNTTEFSEYIEKIMAWAWNFLEFRVPTVGEASQF